MDPIYGPDSGSSALSHPHGDTRTGSRVGSPRKCKEGGRGDGRARMLSPRMVTIAALLLCAALAACSEQESSTATAEVGPRPCDIYTQSGTPCVAAHSTTRALYADYNGPLYEVQRDSDGSMLEVGTLADGYADAAAQDAFCAGASCVITKLFDQSPQHNDLTVAGPGGAGGQDVGVIADKLPIQLGGHQVYGMSFDGGMGYRNNHTSGVATGAEPESMYMVTSGTHVNGNCCFDYGNAEISSLDTGNGHMDAIYFGTSCWFVWGLLPGHPAIICNGTGPWVQADLENGLFMSDMGWSKDSTYTGNNNPFVTAMLKNNGVDTFTVKDANAQEGTLSTHWDGPLPTSPQGNPPQVTIPKQPDGTGPTTIGVPLSNYAPMQKEGAIILGTGGDNSNGAVGSFFEGAMIAGYATDATENAVQATIVAAGYN